MYICINTSKSFYVVIMREVVPVVRPSAPVAAAAPADAAAAPERAHLTCLD